VFEDAAVALGKWFLVVETDNRFNTSLRLLNGEIDVSYRTISRRVQRFLRALDGPRRQLEGPVEIDEFYVKSRLEGRERDKPLCSRGLSTRGRRTDEDKLPVFVLAGRASGDRCVNPAKAATESRIRFLQADRQQESSSVYPDGFRASEPLEEDDTFTRQYLVHGEVEYGDGDVHVNTSESHPRASDAWLSPPRGVSKDGFTPSLRAFHFRRDVCRKPGEEALTTVFETAL